LRGLAHADILRPPHITRYLRHCTVTSPGHPTRDMLCVRRRL
jgi:hypothetical protein